MQVRTQLAIVAVVAAGWSAGNVAFVQPVVAGSSPAERQRFQSLEDRVAQNRDDVRAARALSAQYLERSMWQLTIDTMNRATPTVQQDARVSLHVARAYEQLGDLHAAAARLNGAMSRCTSVPSELAAGAGCDVRTQTELAIESAVVDRMITWGITPVTDPDRAALARELATRPVTLAGTRL